MKSRAGKFHREAMRTNTNHSRGGPPAPKNDAGGFKRGMKNGPGKEVTAFTDFSNKKNSLEPKGGDRSSGKATAAKAGPATGISGGRGGLAIHSSMKGSGMHTDKCMYEERH